MTAAIAEAAQKTARTPRLLAKLKVGAANDPLEREADEIADRVMRMPAPGPALLQRCPGGCPGDEELRRAPSLQRAPTEGNLAGRAAAQEKPDASQVAPALEQQITSMKGRGQPLSRSALAFFEPRFGYDFSPVRVHTDAAGVESARAVHARAFTVGHDIAFGPGLYEPGTPNGMRLLAHELSHVVQQTAGPTTNSLLLQRADDDQNSDLPGTPATFSDLQNMLPAEELTSLSATVAAAKEGEVVKYTTAATRMLGPVQNLTIWAVKRAGTVEYSREFMAGESTALTDQAFIAVADRPLKNTEGSDTFYHYSVQMWHCGGGFADLNRASGYSEAEIADRCRDANRTAPEAKKVDGIELLQITGWRVWAWNGSSWEIFEGSYDINWLLGISEIYNSEAGQRIMPIFSDDRSKVEGIWSALESAAHTYEFAEQEGFGGAFKNWPKSMYRALQTNSNTFARYVVTTAGLTMAEIFGAHTAHPGAWPPSQNTVSGLTFSAKPGAHPWKEGTQDPPMPTFAP